ncbi:MAG TPA: adenylate/guanylate cyclase domain-containing protein [Candidatus Polarisedimenticolaceae bacterium]|nr:adenylate/guanylate cyclase domain-containing protein [Candidatus Polarisedimenticolaceae bacterium]
MRRLRGALLLALVPGVLGVLLAHWPPSENWERSGLDLLFLLRGPRPVPAGVCVVAIDTDSYTERAVDPRGAWPRGLHAELIRTLAREGAKAVAFDVLFEEAADPLQDEALERALAETGIVVLGATVELVEDPRFRQAIRREPYPPFAAAAAEVAEVNLPTDRDGVIRSAWPVHEDRSSLALAAYEVATGDRSRHQPGSRMLDYYGPPRTVPTVSLYQALDPQQFLPPDFFRDKIVFVGLSESAASGPAPKDAYLTPYRAASGSPTYGVEIHATLAANLLENRRIRLLPGEQEAVLLLVLPLVASLTFMALRPFLGLIALAALELLPWTAAWVLFDVRQLWLPVLIPSVVQLPLGYVLSLLWYYLTTVRERERIRRAFSFYLSPDMIRQIADDPGSLELGGEEIEATALFTDIKGFTPIAEKLSAPETAALLNEYFSEATRHVFEAGGTLIKFIGDAVFAIWGAPLKRPDHATQACHAALALARAETRLVTRIGVHTGPMLVGNLGSAQRFDYTAIGDAVNLASRLEGLNKLFDTRALVSGETLSRTDGRFVVRPLGRFRVVGRSEPVEVHELLGTRDEPAPPGASAHEPFARALAEFTAGRLNEAEALFRSVGDGPSAFYVETIARLKAEPLDASWDGVVNLGAK